MDPLTETKVWTAAKAVTIYDRYDIAVGYGFRGIVLRSNWDDDINHLSVDEIMECDHHHVTATDARSCVSEG